MINKLKLILKTITLLVIAVSCREEGYPLCHIDREPINYPVIAHSHNDYEQEFPMKTALDHGFSSIEVDIFYDDKSLRVSHDDDDLSKKPEFENLYLKPLYSDSIGEGGLILLVDLKNYSVEQMEELNNVLEGYESKLVSRTEPDNTANKIKIILSGEYPRDIILNEPRYNYIFIDGRFNEVDINSSSDIVPLISMNISEVSNSNAANKDEIRKAVNQIHDQNKLIRFWNTNDKESVWLTLIDLDVDIVGVDDIEKFCGVMEKNGLVN